jgi:DNA polymerase-1
MKKLYLLDGHALVYRVYYAFMKHPITNSKGVDTSILYGFTKMMMDLIVRERPSHFAVAFDPGGKNFRHDMYAEYKANRLPMPEIIRSSLPLLKSLIEAFNIPLLILPGYEADDVIGTIAKRAESEGFDVYMMTPDKDYAQLVSPHIFMIKPRQGEVAEQLGEAEIRTIYNVARPEQVIDVLTIWGDKVDNVPGVNGVGEIKAKKLIGEFGSVENIYANLQQLPKKLQDAFSAAEPYIQLSKKLVTIDTHVPVPWDEKSLVVEKPDITRLKALFMEYEFASLLPHLVMYGKDYSGEIITLSTLESGFQAKTATDGQLDLFAPTIMPQPLPVATPDATPELTDYKTINTTPHTYHIAQTAEEINQLIAVINDSKCFCFDTETTGVDAMLAELVGMSFSVKAHEAWYVPIPRGREAATEFLQQFQPLFASPKQKIGQNIKYDLLMLKQYGIEITGFLYDTMLMHYLIDPESRHNMTVLSRQYLTYNPVEIEELIGKKGVNQGSMADVPLEKIAEYAAEDADVTFQLKSILEKKLKKENLFDLYIGVEAPLIAVLADMEYEGVRIDTNSLHKYGEKLEIELMSLDREVKAMAEDDNLNISSPKQLGIILFEKLGLAETAKRTKSKHYATDEGTLHDMADSHPIIPKILEYRSLKKLLSSYIEALPELVNPRTGRIHTTFNQFVTATGRLSSNNPNLQNIPVREAKGREIRRAFVPRDDEYTLLSADYSQIELRIMAHMSNDTHMIDAFNSNADIHTATAAKVFHVSVEKVTKEQRTKAKMANFGIIYGISVFGLAQRLQIPRGEAKILIDGYFESYPDIKQYMEDVVKEAEAKGYVETIFGRVRHLLNIHSQNMAVRKFAQRNAINAPIQGSAADIIKLAMISIHSRLKERKLKTKMILQVHDELVFDVYLPELDLVKRLVQYEMEHVKLLRVPLIAEVGTGKNWLEAH